MGEWYDRGQVSPPKKEEGAELRRAGVPSLQQLALWLGHGTAAGDATVEEVHLARKLAEARKEIRWLHGHWGEGRDGDGPCCNPANCLWCKNKETDNGE